MPRPLPHRPTPSRIHTLRAEPPASEPLSCRVPTRINLLENISTPFWRRSTSITRCFFSFTFLLVEIDTPSPYFCYFALFLCVFFSTQHATIASRGSITDDRDGSFRMIRVFFWVAKEMIHLALATAFWVFWLLGSFLCIYLCQIYTLFMTYTCRVSLSYVYIVTPKRRGWHCFPVLGCRLFSRLLYLSQLA